MEELVRDRNPVSLARAWHRLLWLNCSSWWRKASGQFAPSALGIPLARGIALDRRRNGVTWLDSADLPSHDPEGLRATFQAGTQMSAMGDPLHDVGQALINMPDIDEQVIAGAIATGTHGTGANIGGLPSFVTGLEIVTADRRTHTV